MEKSISFSTIRYDTSISKTIYRYIKSSLLHSVLLLRWIRKPIITKKANNYLTSVKFCWCSIIINRVHVLFFFQDIARYIVENRSFCMSGGALYSTHSLTHFYMSPVRPTMFKQQNKPKKGRK